MPSPIYRLPTLLLCLGFSSCSESQKPGPSPRESAAAREAEQATEAKNLGYLDELAHLGYVDFSEEVAEELPEGAHQSAPQIWDREAAWDGINLYLSLPDATGFLMDMDGTVLHTWSDTSGIDTRWSRVELMPDGDVLCVSPKENNLIRMGWDGTERWRIPLDTHHDVRLAADGRVVTLTRKLRPVPELHAFRDSVDNSLAWLNLEGEVLSEHSLYEILAGHPELPMAAPDKIDQAPPGASVDPIHANTIELMRYDALARENPIFAPGNLLITLRVMCAIVMLTPDATHPGGYRVLWHWGVGKLQGPHDATVMENGHILVLDNGWRSRGFSRVLEIDPATGEILWKYKAPEPTDFFTEGRGTVQPLPNGNVLVGNSNSGEAFEVNREGRMVWRFLNPNVDAKNKRGVLRIRRYGRARIEAMMRAAEAR